MKLIARLAAALTCLAVLATSAAAEHQARTNVTFLLVNDIYQMSAEAMPDGKTRGGFARLAAVVKAERAKGGHVIFAHAGDTLSPSLMSGLDRGEHIIALTNMIAPDVFAPGNHEFDFGKEIFAQRMREATFPLYAANLRGEDGAPLPGFKDRGLLTFDGVRIGLTGAAYDETGRLSSPGDLKFAPSVATMKAQAEALRREGADFVLAVAHIERPDAIELYTRGGVDLLLTGHNHDLVVAFDGRAAMAESSHDAHYVVAIDVTISVTERDGRRETTWWPQFRIIDTANVVPDAEVAAKVAIYEAELSREMDAPLASVEVELDSRNATVRTREAAIGDLIADAMRASTGADIALMNGGGIRAGKVYPPGSAITRRDVLAELSFGNRVVAIEISGRSLRAAIENGLSRLPDAAGRFPQVSGMTIKADIKRPPGSRVVAIEVQGKPLVEDGVYTLATNDFIARGSDGYVEFADAKRLTPDYDAKLLANEVMVYLRRLGAVSTRADKRIVLK